MPVAQGLEWLITLVGAYVGINLGSKALAGIQAARNTVIKDDKIKVEEEKANAGN